MVKVDFTKTYKQRRGANVGPSPTCTFITGDKPYGDQPWCGKKSTPGSSYCEHHHTVTHEPFDRDQTTRFKKYYEYLARNAR